MINKDPIRNMIDDDFGIDRHHANEVPLASNEDMVRTESVMPNITQERLEVAEFEELARDGEQLLYAGCRKYSTLSFLMTLYHIKCLCGMSDKAMTMILELLHDAFEYAKIPSSFYEAKKTTSKHGLNYVKIPACPNNCMLYWGENEEKEICKVYNKSRWKSKTKDSENQASSDRNIRHKVPTPIDAPSRAEYESLKSQLQLLQEQMTFLVSQQRGQLLPDCPTNKATNLDSPAKTRCSPSASHEPQGQGPSPSSHP